MARKSTRPKLVLTLEEVKLLDQLRQSRTAAWREVQRAQILWRYFSTFGPDTLKELRACWAAGDEGIHVHLFIDMHDIGDALIRSGLSSPVLDTEYFTLTYRDVYALMRDLKSVGATNVALGRRRALTGKGQLAAVARAYEAYRHLGVLPATYEVIYGHAWVPERGARRQDGSTVASFPLARLRRRAGHQAPTAVALSSAPTPVSARLGWSSD